MRPKSKRYKSIANVAEKGKLYQIAEAIKLLKQLPARKFDESLELHFQLGIKPDQSGEMVRGSASLPFGSGKKVSILCFCKGEGVKEAEAAGADFVGAEELITKVQGGWMEFDSVVAHPDMMREVSKLGKVLGPKGLMPTPKSGTVTTNLPKAIKEIKAGRVDFKSDKTGGLHVSCGKISFEENALVGNATSVISAVYQAKPQGAKPDFLKRVYMSSTQGPGIQLQVSQFAATKEETD